MRKWTDDPYTKKAKAEGFLARSVYKLKEIHKKTGVLKQKKAILDLGAAPGSWTQLCLKNCPKAKITSVDLHKIEIEDPRITFLKSDINELDWNQIESAFDLILSDMAPKTSGNAQLDVDRSVALCEMVISICNDHLIIGGDLVMKVFMGSGFDELQSELKKLFGTVKRMRPASVRKQSKEIYLCCLGRK